MIHLLLALWQTTAFAADSLPPCPGVQRVLQVSAANRLWHWSSGSVLVESATAVAELRSGTLVTLFAKTVEEELLSVLSVSPSRSLFIFSRPKGYRILGFDKDRSQSFADFSKEIHQATSAKASIYTPLVDVYADGETIFLLSSFHMAITKRSDLANPATSLRWEMLPLSPSSSGSRAVAFWRGSARAKLLFLTNVPGGGNNKAALAYEWNDTRWSHIDTITSDAWSAYQASVDGMRMHREYKALAPGERDSRTLSFGKDASVEGETKRLPAVIWRAQLQNEGAHFSGLVSHADRSVYYKAGKAQCALPMPLREIIAPKPGVYTGLAEDQLVQVSF